MGVPFFYRWLSGRYRNVSQTMKRTEVASYFTNKVETLGLDLNGIIHTEASKVYLYGEYESKSASVMSKLNATPATTLERNHFEGIGQAIFDLVKLTKPRDSLFVCVDGPAPFPKLYQQKQRRFKAKSTVLSEGEQYSTHTTEYKSSSIFDSNCITPGTAFMDRLDVFLVDWLQLNKKALNVPRIVYSSHRVPGEGEHKIAHYHRTLLFNESFAKSHTHVVFGLDADLIMIGLLSPKKNYTLLRDDIGARDTSYHVLNIDALRERIREEMGSVQDYVLLTFFAGNDFLPSFPSISIGRGGLDTLIKIYKSTGSRLTSNDGTNRVSWKDLYLFMTTFAIEEPSLLESQSKNPTTYPSVALEFAVRDGKRYDHNLFTTAYYQRALGSKSNEQVYNAEGLQNTTYMADEWLAGVAWVFRYYTEGIDSVNVEWVFHYNYVPLTHEIVVALARVEKSHDMPSFEWEAVEVRGAVLTPYEQLVSVLPPASQQLLPPALQTLITSATSPLVDLTPTQFLVDRSGKMKEHEGVALLPYIDGSRVREAVASVQLTDREKRLNTFAEDMFFKTYRIPYG